MTRTDGPSRSEETRDPGRMRRRPPETLHLLSAVVVWLVTGTTISSLNKWIFAVYNFRYPLLLSALHMLTAIVVDYGLIKYYFTRHKGISEQDLSASAKCKVFLLSLTFCASIAFGNLGLTYVQLSFAQMIYTTTPIFTLAISSLVLGKQHHVLKYTAMMPICIGASFSILGEVQFDQTGCLFVIAATMLRGVKSIQQSNLLQEEKINSVLLLYLMAIPSFCILAVAALVLENWAGFQSPLHYDGHLWGFIVLSCLGSVLYNLASCCVISLTSAVTLHILGNLSVVGNLLLSQLLFGSQFSALSCAGAALTLSGMIIYQNSELIVSYVDAHRTGKRQSAEPEHEPELEPALDLSAEPSAETYHKLEPSSDLEPSSKQSQDSEELFQEPFAELYTDLEQHSELSYKSSTVLYHDLEPIYTQNPDMENVEPFSELHYDRKSPQESRDSKELYLEPVQYNHDLELSLKIPPALDSDTTLSPELSRELYHDLEPLSELYNYTEPSPESFGDLYVDPTLETPSVLDCDQEPSSEPFGDLYYNLELDLEPSSEIPQALYCDIEPKSESSRVMYNVLEPLLETSPALKCNLEPLSDLYDDTESPAQCKYLYNDTEPPLETPPALDYDLELSPKSSTGQYHNLEPSLEVSQALNCDLEPESKLFNDTESPLEPPRELHLEPSPGLDHDLEPLSEISLALDCDTEPTSGLPRVLYRDLEPPQTTLALDSAIEPSSDPSPFLNSDLEPSSDLYDDTETCRELFHDCDLEPPPNLYDRTELSRELYHELEPSLVTSTALSCYLEPSSELSSELYDDPECPPESSRELYLGQSPLLDCEVDPSSELSRKLYHDLEPSLETSPGLKCDLEPSSDLSHNTEAPS